MSLMSRLASLVLLVVIVNGQNQNQVPSGFTCPSMETSHHPVFGNCERYITCYRSTAFLQFCPLGLLFDSANLVCDFPDRVNCDKCPPTGVATIGLNCQNYRLCVNGVAIEKTCPDGTFFDEKKGECNVPTEGQDACPFVPCQGVRGNITFQTNPKNCHIGYICVDGNLVSQRNCSETMFFDNGICVIERPASCPVPGGLAPVAPGPVLPGGQRPGGTAPVAPGGQAPVRPGGQTPVRPGGQSPPTRPRKAALKLTACPPEGTALVMADGDCTSYSICSEGNILARKSCPEGLYFNDELEICSMADLAYCPYE